MPLLNRQGELIEAAAINDGSVTAGGVPLIPVDEWVPGSGDGLLLEVDAEPRDEFSLAPLIAVDFPAFNDGRGLSLAVLLRTRFAFTGELRAVGDVHPDMLHYLRRCGFDSFLMPEGRKPPQASNSRTVAPYTDYYQASVLEPNPVYRRIRRGA